MSWLKKTLKHLLIVQEVSNTERDINNLKRLGKGYFIAFRLNPYNPLSYIALVLMVIIGILMYGFVGIFKETDYHNPFKWY